MKEEWKSLMNELNEERYQDTHSKDKSEEIKQITNDSKRIQHLTDRNTK